MVDFVDAHGPLGLTCPPRPLCSGWYVRAWDTGVRDDSVENEYPPLRPGLTALDFVTNVPTIDLAVTGPSAQQFPWRGFAYNMGLEEWFAASFEAYLTIGTEGSYTFSITSDDGAYLELLDASSRTVRIVDNPGVHAVSTVTGAVSLTAGVFKVGRARCERRWEKWSQRAQGDLSCQTWQAETGWASCDSQEGRLSMHAYPWNPPSPLHLLQCVFVCVCV